MHKRLGREPSDAELARALEYVSDIQVAGTLLPPDLKPDVSQSAPHGRGKDTLERTDPLIRNIMGMDIDVARSLIISTIVESFFAPIVAEGGMDDRVEPLAIKDDAAGFPAAAAVMKGERVASEAVGIFIHSAETTDERLLLPTAQSLGSRRGLCEGQRFAVEPSLEGCAGVLVSLNTVATADHCVDGDEMSSLWFVFDYQNGMNSVPGTPVPQDDAYRVKSLRARSASDGWAVVELDRAVVGREPVEIRTREPDYVAIGEYVFMIGHPDGIPLKISRSGKAIGKPSATRFLVDLDLTAGDAGSPVFDRAQASRRRMVGLVVAGKDNYRRKGECMIAARCLMSEGCVPSEYVLRADLIPRALGK